MTGMFDRKWKGHASVRKHWEFFKWTCWCVISLRWCRILAIHKCYAFRLKRMHAVRCWAWVYSLGLVNNYIRQNHWNINQWIMHFGSGYENMLRKSTTALPKEWHEFVLAVRCNVREKSQIYSYEQGKSEGFDSCDRPSNLTQIGLKSLIFQPVWPWNLMDDLEKQ